MTRRIKINLVRRTLPVRDAPPPPPKGCFDWRPEREIVYGQPRPPLMPAEKRKSDG